MGVFKCGELTVTIAFIQIAPWGKYRWSYSAEFDGATIASGSDLETPTNDDISVVRALIDFLVYMDSEGREDNGWTFDAEALMVSLDGFDNGRETVWRVVKANA